MANDTMTAADVLGRFHEAEGRFFESGGADVPSFEGILHPDFVLVEPTDGPYGGEWRGREGLLGFLNAMNDDWSEQGPIEAPELIEQGDRVVALATIRAKARETGRVVEFPLCQVALVRDGLLAETRVFYWDTKEMKTALGNEDSTRQVAH